MSSKGEYYCTNCEASLRKQPGFNPDAGNWICTKCGQELYGDGVYEGEKYPKIMWHCDGCGTFLNVQSDFSDTKGTWVCTECGFCNKIDESKIEKETFKDKLLKLKSKPVLKKVLKWTLIAAGAISAAAIAIKVSQDRDKNDEGSYFIGDTNEREYIHNPCQNCGQSLSGGMYTAPWEEDNNPDGYTVCPHCGYINFEWED